MEDVLVGMEAVGPADADTSFSDAASSAAAVAAVVAAAPAGYGHQLGGGSTAAGPTLPLRVRYLLRRRSGLRIQLSLRKKLTKILAAYEPNSVLSPLPRSSIDWL
jgi:hypothetical protein